MRGRKIGWSSAIAVCVALVTVSLAGQQVPTPAAEDHGELATPGAPRTAPQQAVNITSKDLLNGLGDPSRWLMYSGDYTGKRHSPLTQITPANIGQLVPQWTFQTGYLGQTGPIGRRFESTPLLVNGILYVTGEMDHAWAIDARTGKELWHHTRKLPGPFKGDPGTWNAKEDTPVAVRSCCGSVNRGFAVYKDKLYKVTLDMHLLALDMKTGKTIWDVEVDSWKKAYAGTVAPLVVKDKIIVGNAGAEFATRGFLAAYDPDSGKEVWRFWTIPLPGEPGGDTWPSVDAALKGGASTWVTGVYDPEFNLIYWGTGNPNPDYYGGHRKGDNLYSNSMIALDADTGKLKWHHQFTPWDEWDFDATQTPVIADIPINGRTRKVIMTANRNGFFYVFDRATGEFLVGKAFTGVTWAKGLDAKGRPIDNPDARPSPEGRMMCGGGSATNWMHPSYDPSLRLFYVNARDGCRMATHNPNTPHPSTYAVGDRMPGTGKPVPLPAGAPRGYASLKAIDPTTGQQKWEMRYAGSSSAGVMTTASGLTFFGDGENNFLAIDSATGKELWRHNLGGPIFAAATTYMLGGRQYVLIPAATTLTSFALLSPPAAPTSAQRP
jgi:alcohol dehydrogenase (cytochrome c)